jgi:hypothetical protein
MLFGAVQQLLIDALLVFERRRPAGRVSKAEPPPEIRHRSGHLSGPAPSPGMVAVAVLVSAKMGTDAASTISPRFARPSGWRNMVVARHHQSP